MNDMLGVGMGLGQGGGWGGGNVERKLGVLQLRESLGFLFPANKQVAVTWTLWDDFKDHK